MLISVGWEAVFFLLFFFISGPFAFEQNHKPASAENRGRPLKLARMAQQRNAPEAEITATRDGKSKNSRVFIGAHLIPSLLSPFLTFLPGFSLILSFPPLFLASFSRPFLHLDLFPFPTLPGTTRAPAELAGHKNKVRKRNHWGGVVMLAPVGQTHMIHLKPLQTLKKSLQMFNPGLRFHQGSRNVS